MNNTQETFTIEQFYQHLTQEKIMAGKCLKCGKIHLPPRPLCNTCYTTQFKWTQIPNKGQLLTYTIIHIAPPQFQNLAPYIIGIIELEGGLKLPGIIQNIPQEQLKIGMTLHVDFSNCSTPENWPKWPKYCLKP
jgi:uncharacterized OB-fold protein